MSIKKILAAAVASVMAVSAMAVSAFAAEIEVPANADGWKDVEIFKDYDSLTKLLDSGKTPEDVESITIKSAGSAIGIGYHAADADLTWVQPTDNDENAWFTDSKTIKASEISLTKDKAYLKAFGNNIEDPATVEVTFTYKAAAAADTTAAANTEAASTTAAPANGNTAPSDKGNADTGVEGVAVVASLAVLAAGAIVVAKKRK